MFRSMQWLQTSEIVIVHHYLPSRPPMERVSDTPPLLRGGYHYHHLCHISSTLRTVLTTVTGLTFCHWRVPVSVVSGTASAEPSEDGSGGTLAGRLRNEIPGKRPHDVWISGFKSSFCRGPARTLRMTTSTVRPCGRVCYTELRASITVNKRRVVPAKRIDVIQSWALGPRPGHDSRLGNELCAEAVRRGT